MIRSQLALLGCDHRRASTRRRAALRLPLARREELLRELTRRAGGRGLVVLETCARSEWLADVEDPLAAIDVLDGWMSRRLGSRPRGGESRPAGAPLALSGNAALRHALRVAVGLESFILGEREIAGQFQQALREARLAGLSSPLLDRLGGAAGRLVRRVERGTAFRSAGRSLAHLAVDHLEQALAPAHPAELRLGVAGLGDIGARVWRVAARRGFQLSAFSRSPRPELASRPLHDLARHLGGLQGLVVATAAPSPVLRLDGRSPLVVDLGVPPQVRATAEHSHYRGLDQLLDWGRPAAVPDMERASEQVERALAELRAQLEPLALRSPPAAAARPSASAKPAAPSLAAPSPAAPSPAAPSPAASDSAPPSSATCHPSLAPSS